MTRPQIQVQYAPSSHRHLCSQVYTNLPEDSKLRRVTNSCGISQGTPGSGKVLIVDNTMTVGPFYEASLKKMGADPTTVEVGARPA